MHPETLCTAFTLADAVRALDEWDELGFHKAHAALTRRFPEQAEFIFNDLTAAQGPGAVLAIMKFLDRLDVLEKGTGRDATHDADLKALELLSARGIDATERARLRDLIAVAQSELVMSARCAQPLANRSRAHH